MNKRQDEILTCVIDYFIDTPQPISSKMVLDKLSIQLSSATVRQVFSVLDNEGYLAKLHTSSGRVPTDKGYRRYVDKIQGGSEIALAKVVTDNSYQIKFRYFFEQLLEKISSKIPYISMIMLNDQALADIANIKYVSISSHYGLILIFHKVGIVSEHYVRFDQDISSCKTDGLIEVLLTQFQQGLSFDIVPNQSGIDLYFIQMVAQKIIKDAEVFPSDGNVLIKNVNQCLRLADYSDKHQIQDLLSVLDEKLIIQRLMASGLQADGLKVHIGQELNDERLTQSSFISIPIVLDGIRVACFGILGPRRMDYSKTIQLLSSAETLAELI